jgi:phage I-like protein
VKSFFSKKVVIGAAAIVVLVGAGSALAATLGSDGSGAQAYVNDVAKHLNVTPGAVTAAMNAAADERIDAALASGRISKSQAEDLKQRVQGGGVPFFGDRLGGRGFGGRLDAAARYLAIDRATLRSDLESRKSLAQIASSTPGKSVDGLKAAITAAAKTRLAHAVSSGSISSQEEQERLSELSGRIDAQLRRTAIGGPDAGSGYGLAH